MSLKSLTKQSTHACSDKISCLRKELAACAALVIGAGAGLSSAAGLTYYGERFRKYFSDFEEKYGIRDMYSGGFFPFPTKEEFWGWWCRHIFVNRYKDDDNGLYKRLFELVKDKDYFVLTTNVDHQFQKAGFDKQRLFYTQGDYGLFQCSEPCHNTTYDNKEIIREMYEKQKDMRIPTELIPRCPKCSKPMSINLRCDDTFVEDDGWHAASRRYTDFISSHNTGHILFLELGVGMNTPAIIKFPFWNMTAQNPEAVYACINYGESYCPDIIRKQAICIDDDIRTVLS